MLRDIARSYRRAPTDMTTSSRRPGCTCSSTDSARENRPLSETGWPPPRAESHCDASKSPYEQREEVNHAHPHPPDRSRHLSAGESASDAPRCEAQCTGEPALHRSADMGARDAGSTGATGHISL